MTTFCAFSDKQRLAMSWWNQPHTKQRDAIICDGAVRSGKTLSMSLGFVGWAMSNFQGGNFAICGKTIVSIQRNVITQLLRLLEALGFSCSENISRHYVDISLRHVQNRFYLFGGKDESSAALIQGMTLCGVLLNEVTLMPRSFVEQALARCSVRHAKLWFNCNPDSPTHWFYQEWIQKAAEKNALYVHFTMNDNPSLTPSVRKRYTRLYSGTFYDRFVLGKWTITDGQIYTMFSPTKHVIEDIPTCDKYWISCDYGTINPCAMGLWGHYDGVWYRIKEYYYDSKRAGLPRTDEEHYAALEALAAGYAIEAVIVDPSAASFIACIQRHGKFRTIKADNDVCSGIQQVCSLLQQEKLKFHNSCKDILREFQQYSWSDSAKGDVPKKEHDHAMDDMRYFVRTIACRNQDDAFFVMAANRSAAAER